MNESLLNVAASPDNEATAYPWWAVVRNAGLGRYELIAGPFFSRRSAANYLDSTRHRHGRSAFVFCFSGHESSDWSDLYAASRKLRAEIETP